MSRAAARAATRSIAEAIARADPARPRPLGGLVERLAGEGLLREVLRDGVGLGGDPVAVGERAVHGVTEDSRLVRPGDLFVAVRGAHADGHDHLVGAVAAGAVAAIVERAVPHVAGLQLVVDRSRAALAAAAGWWYGDPSRELAVVGVTGTDGKTTTSFLVAAALDAAGLPAGLVGTVETRVGRTRERTPDHVTTPGAMRLQGLLRAMVAGRRSRRRSSRRPRTGWPPSASPGSPTMRRSSPTSATSISSSTARSRRTGRPSSACSSGSAPGRRSPTGGARLAIVNADDPAADLFVAAGRSAGARVLTYGLAQTADVRATTIEEDARGLRVGVATSGWSGSVALRLAGRFNAHNALAAIALGVGWDLDLEAVRSGLEAVAGVPGRMERIDRGQPFAVIVDYAHSPAALRTVLDLLGPVASAGGGGLIAVFGSAGERDTEKRPMMGRVAGERCRLVVLTDEDPRGEDRDAILDAIARGAEDAGRRRDDDLLLVPDRARAIATAFGRAGPGDLVLLAGKGHEPTIIGAGGPVAWDERAEAERALRELGYGAGD